jgi:hypothetical protein
MYTCFPGYLSAPDVTVIYHMQNHSVLFSWSAPFSLNISDSEPDILYYVITIDSISKTVKNITDTHYLLQFDTCLFLEYHVEIAAVNVVGVGEKYTSPPLPLEGILRAIQHYSYVLPISHDVLKFLELSLSQTSVSFSKESLIIQIQVCNIIRMLIQWWQSVNLYNNYLMVLPKIKWIVFTLINTGAYQLPARDPLHC